MMGIVESLAGIKVLKICRCLLKHLMEHRFLGEGRREFQVKINYQYIGSTLNLIVTILVLLSTHPLILIMYL